MDIRSRPAPRLRYLLAQPLALPGFAAACLALAYSVGGGGDALDAAAAPDALAGAATAIGVGLAAGAPLAASRLASHRISRGGEPPDGRALERALIDAKTGSHAIPAPHDWRATEGPWRVGARAVAKHPSRCTFFCAHRGAGVFQGMGPPTKGPRRRRDPSSEYP